ASLSASLSLWGNKEFSPLPLIPAMWLTSRSCCVVACSASLISKALERMCVHTHPHTHTHARTLTRKVTEMLTQFQTHTHTRARTHTHARTRTHTHTHTQTCSHNSGFLMLTIFLSIRQPNNEWAPAPQKEEGETLYAKKGLTSAGFQLLFSI